MSELVNINGELFAPAEARISVFDRGFLLADSVYEVIRTYRAIPFMLEQHLQRLRKSAEGLAMRAIVDGLPLADEVRRTVAAAGLPESYIRVIVTRGAGLIGLDPRLAGAPTMVIIVTELRSYPDEMYQRGVNVALVGAEQRLRGAGGSAIKAGNYLLNMMALHDALRRGAEDGVMVGPDGYLTEGTTSNVFAVIDGRLVTPPLAAGILAGITRSLVLQLAAHAHVHVVEEEIEASKLFAAAEAFLTSTIREVLPVSSCDGRPIGSVVPGPMTRLLANALRRMVQMPLRYPDAELS